MDKFVNNIVITITQAFVLDFVLDYVFTSSSSNFSSFTSFD